MDAQRGKFWPQPPSGVAARSEIGNFRRPYTAGPGPRVPRRAERDDPIRAAGRSILQIRENEICLANFSYFAGINEIGEDKPAMTLQRSEEHTSELQSHHDLVCRLLLEKKK